MIEIYTDGACKGNPGPGGYGVIVLDNNKLIYYYHKPDQNTTNNREELKAILHAFKLIEETPILADATIYTDSSYCYNICNDWIHKWSFNNWRNSKNETIANKDLIENLYNNYIGKFPFCQIKVEKVKGHAGVAGNELSDAAACDDTKKFYKVLIDNDIDHHFLGYF